MLEKRGNINVTGIYAITNMQGKVKYVGGSVEVNDAYSRHKHNLNNGKYYESNKHNLQVLFNQEDLLFTVLDECSAEELDDMETYYIEMYEATIVNSDKKGKRRKSKSTPEEKERRRLANAGENNPHCTCLTALEASEILWLKKNTNMKQKDIAEAYEVKANLVSRVGKDRWEDIEAIQPIWYIEKETDTFGDVTVSTTTINVNAANININLN